MVYRIASFNMYKFSFQSDSDIKKNIIKIANIIIKERFHVIALQEILNPNAATLLKRALGPQWRYRWDQPKIGYGFSNSAQAAEGYAFFWDTKVMELAPTQEIERIDGKPVLVNRFAEPTIFNQYTVNIANGEKRLIRNPYYARFRPVHGFCELRLIKAQSQNLWDLGFRT